MSLTTHSAPVIPVAPLLTPVMSNIVPNGTTIRITRHEVPDGMGICAAQDVVEAVDADGRVVDRCGSGRIRAKLDGIAIPCEPHQEDIYQAGIQAGRRIAESAIRAPIPEGAWRWAELAEAADHEMRKNQPHWSPTGDR